MTDQEMEEAQREIDRKDKFYTWFLEREKDKVLRILQDLSEYIIRANSIYPTYLAECDQKRAYQDVSLGLCYNLLSEFQHILSIVPIDINKYAGITEKINTEIKLIKGWRAAGNKVRKKITEKMKGE